MTRIFGLGEIVYDVLFKEMQPLAAKAGGSMLNSLVSLARTGQKAYMISETGNDLVSEAIITFLKENKVNTEYIIADWASDHLGRQTEITVSNLYLNLCAAQHISRHLWMTA